MGIKLHILLLVAITSFSAVIAQEKFLKISGTLSDEQTKVPINGFTVRVVQDGLDSSEVYFSKDAFTVWAPANRRTNVYFEKEGYLVKYVFIDASYIPSIAFKEKQAIELQVEMTANGSAGKRDFTATPVMTAEYSAAANSFSVKASRDVALSGVPDDYVPPFPAPVDTYKGAQPTLNTLAITATYNKSKVRPGSDFCTVLQGILFADMNYCFFNERTNDANVVLAQLAAIDPDRWGNLENFDSPEYGKIVMRTLNREQSADTLFALGCYVETSRLIFENFTSEGKILVHLKKLRDLLFTYNPETKSSLADFIAALKAMTPLITEIESHYTESIRTKSGYILRDDPTFIRLKDDNLAVYNRLIE